MKIVVFGANGKVGNLVVDELLSRDHQITAFVYGKSDFTKSDNLTVFSGDVRNREDIAEVLKGADCVVSTLGSWGTKTKDILSSGMTNIIPEMEQRGIKRIVSLTGSAAFVQDDKWGLAARVMHRIFSLIAPKIIQDAEVHAKLLAKSSLEWTIIRSPVMNNLGSSTYVLNNNVPGVLETINRRAVARAMADALEKDSFIRQAPHIHRS